MNALLILCKFLIDETKKQLILKLYIYIIFIYLLLHFLEKIVFQKFLINL